MKTGRPIHRESLFDFFSQRVQDASQRRGASLSTPTTTYLTQLLTRLGEEGTVLPKDAPRTLAELHLQAREAPRPKALRLYRALGDHALATSGYFAESLSRRAVGRRYYADMGGAAYARVVDLSTSGPISKAAEIDPWIRAFIELGLRFDDCVALLSDIADRDRAEGTDDLRQLFQEWQRTGSEHAARRLAELGSLPGRGPSELA